MQNFTTLIVDMAKQEKLFASQGGPIIIAQVGSLDFLFFIFYFYFIKFLFFYWINTDFIL